MRGHTAHCMRTNFVNQQPSYAAAGSRWPAGSYSTM